ncbi:MAG: hypothetical protein ABH874_05735 [Methanobacteriota archaeon]
MELEKVITITEMSLSVDFALVKHKSEKSPMLELQGTAAEEVLVM